MTENIAARIGRKKCRITAAALIGTMILFLLAAQTSVSLAEDKIADPGESEKTVGEQTAVYERVIAHGGGSYRGYETTNSAEALNSAIANGYKIIELDMQFSSDRDIIMLHDWDRTAAYYYGADFPKKLSRNQFLKLKVHGELEVLTFDKLSKVLDQNPDVRIVTDIKEDCLELLACIAEQYPGYAARFIPQIYDFDQWSKVRELGYRDIILTLYAMADPDPEKIAEFAGEHQIYAVTMPDYMAEKGICSQLSDQGMIVYVHPVSGYEDALRVMRQGAYGVYSGSLLPGEFAGVEKEYYLTAADPDGSAVKLTDHRIGDWKELKLYGQKPEDTVLYFIDDYMDDSRRFADDSDFAGLAPGKHKLTVRISEREEIKGTLVYYLWKDAGHLRVLHKKYEYRLDDLKPEKDFYAIMQEEGVEAETGEILSRSLVAKADEHTYYVNGSREIYMNAEELMTVQKGRNGTLLLPLSDTVQRLGADSVTMNRAKYLTISFNNEESTIMVNSSLVRRGFSQTRLNTQVVLYLNKAMAAGEFFGHITGRDYIEKDGIVIVLPKDTELDEKGESLLIGAAKKLYE